MVRHKKREIIYPFLLKASAHAQDNFWRFIFEDLSYGLSPYGTFFHKDNLCCNLKGKEFNYKLCPDKPSEDTFEDIYKVLKERAKILSDKEKLIEREKISRSRLHPTIIDKKDDKWQSVKKKMIRDTLVEQYVLTNTHLYHLTLNVAKQLLSFIIIGMMFKTIMSDDIYYDNGYIKAIGGFHYSPSLVIITKNIFSSETKLVSDLRSKKNYGRGCVQPRLLSEHWNTYLTEYGTI